MCLKTNTVIRINTFSFQMRDYLEVIIIVTVNIFDDNAPRFYVAKCTANVNENQSAGMTVTWTQVTSKFNICAFNLILTSTFLLTCSLLVCIQISLGIFLSNSQTFQMIGQSN